MTTASETYVPEYNHDKKKADVQSQPTCVPTQPTGTQTHVHEYLGSTRIAEAQEDPHNHRFAGVTSQVIPVGDSHVHTLLGNTDFYEDHHHEVGATTGLPIPVGEGRHVHFVSTTTTMDDGHFHELIFATLIQDPIGEEA